LVKETVERRVYLPGIGITEIATYAVSNEPTRSTLAVCAGKVTSALLATAAAGSPGGVRSHP
jgi:hypothetical protein